MKNEFDYIQMCYAITHLLDNNDRSNFEKALKFEHSNSEREQIDFDVAHKNLILAECTTPDVDRMVALCTKYLDKSLKLNTGAFLGKVKEYYLKTNPYFVFATVSDYRFHFAQTIFNEYYKKFGLVKFNEQDMITLFNAFLDYTFPLGKAKDVSEKFVFKNPQEFLDEKLSSFLMIRGVEDFVSMSVKKSIKVPNITRRDGAETREVKDAKEVTSFD